MSYAITEPSAELSSSALHVMTDRAPRTHVPRYGGRVVETSAPNLPAQLWPALDGLERRHAEQGAGPAAMPSLRDWSNLLRVLDGTGTASRDLPNLLRLSKRAVRSRVARAVRHGWAEEGESGRGRATVRLTAKGVSVAGQWEPLRSSAERAWESRAGAGAVRQLRDALEALVAQFPLEHPHYPAGYGATDTSITGGNGADWKAVPREPGDTVSSLPLSALLSQALVAFAMAYEQRSEVALLLCATVLKRVPPEGHPASGLGSSVGRSALERHGFIRSGSSQCKPTIHLTSRGRRASDAHEELLRAVERDWRKTFGDTIVDEVYEALRSVG